jgi:hypothetical protein
MRNLFSLLPQPVKELLIYGLAMILGVSIVSGCVYFFGYEDTIVMGLGFVIGKLLLIDLKK